MSEMPIHREINKNFFKKWSPEMAYVLGFFTADGNMLKNRRGAHFIEFQITDKDLLYTIRKTLGSNHKITARNRGENYKKSYRLQIGSKEIFSGLKKLGMTPNKSNTIKFPKVPKRYLGSFVRGYFDGDGCVHLGRYFRKDRNRWKWQFSTNFTSGSRKFLVGLWESLNQHVAGGRIGRKARGYELVFSQRDSIALFKLMYDNIPANLFLKRKLDIFKKAIKVMKLRA